MRAFLAAACVFVVRLEICGMLVGKVAQHAHAFERHEHLHGGRLPEDVVPSSEVNVVRQVGVLQPVLHIWSHPECHPADKKVVVEAIQVAAVCDAKVVCCLVHAAVKQPRGDDVAPRREISQKYQDTEIHCNDGVFFKHG